jgi:hypothetical protein
MYWLDWSPEMLRSFWYLIRLPLLLGLVVLEPVVAFMLGTLALLGLLTTGLFMALGAAHFPAGVMLTISLGFAVALVLYEGLIAALST